MKNKLKRVVLSFGVFILVFIMFGVVSEAKEYSLNNGHQEEQELRGASKRWNNKTKDYLLSRDGLEHKVYYGSISGKLSKTNEYKLYPVQLEANQYLQLRLNLPMDDSVDYDLLLLDSSMNIVKTSGYATYLNEDGSLPETLNYVSKGNEKVYVCVYSGRGGNENLEYKVEYAFVTNMKSSAGVSDNLSEAKELNMVEGSSYDTDELISPLDNRWYKVTITKDEEYDKTRFLTIFSSTVNKGQLEVYRDLAPGNYAMQRLGRGGKGLASLESGTYYFRVFNAVEPEKYVAGEDETYRFSIDQVSAVSRIENLQVISDRGSPKVNYNEGELYRVDSSLERFVMVTGRAYYKTKSGKEIPASFAEVNCVIHDEDWESMGRPDLADVNKSSVANEEGYFKVSVGLNKAAGGHTFSGDISTHYYDYMSASIQDEKGAKLRTVYFYYLQKSELY